MMSNMSFYNGITFKNIKSKQTKNISPIYPKEEQSLKEIKVEEVKIPEIIEEEEDEISILIDGVEPIIKNDYTPVRKQNPLVTYVPYSNRNNTEQKPNNLYSKFCSNLINNGDCTFTGCTFAHTVKQYSPLKCKYNCNNRKCNFWHFWENIQEYIQRMNIAVPEKILMEGIIQEAKNYKVDELLRSKKLAFETQLQLECNLQSVQKEIECLHKLGYKNINLKITDERESKVRVENLSDYVSFINKVLPFMKYPSIDKITNEDRKRLSFYLPEIPKYINHIKVVNGESQKIASDILGDVNGWDAISQLQDIIGKYYPEKNWTFRCLEVESYEYATSIQLSIILDIF